MASTTLNLGGVNWKSSSSKTPYTNIYNKYAQYEKASRDAYVSGLGNQLKADQGTTNAQYNNNARQYYIQNMQAQKSLPSQLANNGLTGGASESAVIRMNNAYGQNFANNESGRATSLNNLQTTYNNNVAEYDRNYKENLSKAYQTSMENQLKYEQEQNKLDLQYFANSVANRYNSSKAWKKAIARMKKSKEPNKKYKVALLEQGFTNWKIAKKKSSGGGGGGGSRRSYGGYRSGYSGYRNNYGGTGYSYKAPSTKSKPKKSKGKSSKAKSKKSKGTFQPAWRISGL